MSWIELLTPRHRVLGLSVDRTPSQKHTHVLHFSWERSLPRAKVSVHTSCACSHLSRVLLPQLVSFGHGAAEHALRAADFNSQTQQVTWEKPSLLLPGWKEAMHKESGRVYYYNKKTKATSWHMPPKEFGRST